MNSATDDNDREQTRHLARETLKALTDVQKLVLAEHSAMARWLTASLLAVNGAGALAVFNAAERLSRPEWDGGSFVLGVLAALLSAVLGQKINRRGSEILGEAIGHAMFVAHTGEMNEAAEQASKELQPRIKKGAKWPPAMGWLSAFLFACGAAFTGLDRPVVDPANLQRCIAIQHDMLLVKSRAQTDAATFQALGCKPQGNDQPFNP